MQRSRLGFGGSSALGWSLGVAIIAACSVYDTSLLTGGSEGQGGTLSGGDGSGGDSGTSTGATGNGGSEGGGTGGKGGSGANGGTAGSGTGGSNGGTSGAMTGGKGGTDPTGGDGGDPGTGGDAGSGGKGGTAGSAGDGGTAGSGGSGGNGGSGGGCGKCGCNPPDDDNDGVPNCEDICDTLNDAHCTVLRNGLVHRYSFSGTGTVATDSKGGTSGNGQILNATLTGTGSVTLPGGNTTSPPYVNLPNGIVSSLTNATFEAWLTWNQSGTTGQTWQRIFDFGTTGVEDFPPNASPDTTGTSYLFVTGMGSSYVKGVFSASGTSGEMAVTGTMALARGMQQHVALVIDDQNDQMVLYLNGAPQVSLLSFTGQLSQITDVNNWLGRSNFSRDYELNASYNEFRIYNVALTTQQIDTSFDAGPDATFL
jgi:hypothetical protein